MKTQKIRLVASKSMGVSYCDSLRIVVKYAYKHLQIPMRLVPFHIRPYP